MHIAIIITIIMHVAIMIILLLSHICGVLLYKLHNCSLIPRPSVMHMQRNEKGVESLVRNIS